jgi:hypothetical protein
MKSKNDCPPETYELLETLTREFFQTEASAARHARREASRLGGVPPARALLAVATHAEQVLHALPELARKHGLPVSAGGRTLGTLFSEARDKLGDLLIDSERSFRGTLLGCRHGIDLVRLMRHATNETRDVALAEYLDEWIASRVVLVENLEEELAWFAKNPHEAQKNARAHMSLRTVISRGARL